MPYIGHGVFDVELSRCDYLAGSRNGRVHGEPAGHDLDQTPQLRLVISGGKMRVRISK